MEENTGQSGQGQSEQGKPRFHHRRPGMRRPMPPKPFRPKDTRRGAEQKGVTYGNQTKISIVVPLYNEEESLRPLANEIVKALANSYSNFEVIFVDDGSRDRSLQILRELSNEDKRFKYVSFQMNCGKSAALQVGFKASSGSIIITMDADLQDDPHEIPNLIKKINEGHDMVSGWKKRRYDPFIKKITSRFFNMITRWMSGIKIHDFNCGLKAYRQSVVQNIHVYGEMHRYIPVLANWQGFTIGELAVQHHPRKYGKTKFGVSRFYKGFIDLVTVMFVTRYTKRPMHLFGFLGAICIVLGVGLNVFLLLQKFLYHTSFLAKDGFLLGVLLIVVGIQFFSMGLIGELMVHNFQTTKEYKIKEKRIK